MGPCLPRADQTAREELVGSDSRCFHWYSEREVLMSLRVVNVIGLMQERGSRGDKIYLSFELVS